jgi:hypothetical protein
MSRCRASEISKEPKPAVDGEAGSCCSKFRKLLHVAASLLHVFGTWVLHGLHEMRRIEANPWIPCRITGDNDWQDVVEQQTPNQAKSTKNKSTIIISSYMFILIHYISCINNSIWFLSLSYDLFNLFLCFSHHSFFLHSRPQKVWFTVSTCVNIFQYFQCLSPVVFLVVYTVYTRCVHSVLECFLWSTPLIFSKLTGPEDPWSVWGDPGPWKVQN